MTFRGRESTSVGLAHLRTRLNARGLGASHVETARRLAERLAIRELLPTVLARSVGIAIARP